MDRSFISETRLTLKPQQDSKAEVEPGAQRSV
jgi:hypothetical protein